MWAAGKSGFAMTHYTMREILSSYTPEKRAETSIWARIFSRPVSFAVTYLLINLGMSANLVSVLSIFVALSACIFLMAGPAFFWAGILLFLFWDVLDCTDGNIARVKKTASASGEYLDAASGYAAPAFIYLAVGVAAYDTAACPAGCRFVFIIFGAAASVSDLLARLLYQKYAVTEYKLGLFMAGGAIAEKRKHGLLKAVDTVMRNLTYSCLFMPLLVLANVTRRFDILISFYALYSVVVLAGAFIYFIRRAFLFDNSKGQIPNDRILVPSARDDRDSRL